MSLNQTEIIIVSYNTKRLISNCLDSIFRTVGTANVKVTVVDNASTDGTVDHLKNEYPAIDIIVNEKNIGYGAAMNIGINNSNREYLVLANSDLFFHENTLHDAIEFLKANDNIGVLGLQLIYPNNTWQISYSDYPGIRSAIKNFFFVNNFERWIRRFYWTRSKFDHHPIKVDWLNGACLFTRRSVMKEIGGYDESFYFYSEDTDLCKRIDLLGKDVIFNPQIEVTHVQGASSDDATINPKNIELLVDGIKLYCSKYLTDIESKIYKFSLAYDSFLMSILSNILSVFFKRFKKRAEYFRLFFEELRKISF